METNDNGGFLWGLLGCCIPIVGLVLFLVWKDQKPKTAKAAGIGALISVLASVLTYVIFFVILGAASLALGYTKSPLQGLIQTTALWRKGREVPAYFMRLPCYAGTFVPLSWEAVPHLRKMYGRTGGYLYGNRDCLYLGVSKVRNCRTDDDSAYCRWYAAATDFL